MMLGRGGVDLPDESDEEDDDFVPGKVIFVEFHSMSFSFMQRLRLKVREYLNTCKCVLLDVPGRGRRR